MRESRKNGSPESRLERPSPIEPIGDASPATVEDVDALEQIKIGLMRRVVSNEPAQTVADRVANTPLQLHAQELMDALEQWPGTGAARVAREQLTELLVALEARRGWKGILRTQRQIAVCERYEAVVVGFENLLARLGAEHPPKERPVVLARVHFELQSAYLIECAAVRPNEATSEDREAAARAVARVIAEAQSNENTKMAGLIGTEGRVKAAIACAALLLRVSEGTIEAARRRVRRGDWSVTGLGA